MLNGFEGALDGSGAEEDGGVGGVGEEGWEEGELVDVEGAESLAEGESCFLRGSSISIHWDVKVMGILTLPRSVSSPG